MTRLEGKIAVITGGGTGIGLASAKRFIAEGAFVYLFGRRTDKLEAAVGTLGANARAVAGSVTDASDLDRLYDTVKQAHGKLDILFANAGTGALSPLSEITPDHVDATLDVNVKGTIFTVQKGIKLMEQGGSVMIAAGQVRTPAQAEEAITAGLFLVALGQALVIDPDWVAKARDGRDDAIKADVAKSEARALHIPDKLWAIIEMAQGWFKVRPE